MGYNIHTTPRYGDVQDPHGENSLWLTRLTQPFCTDVSCSRRIHGAGLCSDADCQGHEVHWAERGYLSPWRRTMAHCPVRVHAEPLPSTDFPPASRRRVHAGDGDHPDGGYWLSGTNGADESGRVVVGHDEASTQGSIVALHLVLLARGVCCKGPHRRRPVPTGQPEEDAECTVQGLESSPNATGVCSSSHGTWLADGPRRGAVANRFCCSSVLVHGACQRSVVSVGVVHGRAMPGPATPRQQARERDLGCPAEGGLGGVDGAVERHLCIEVVTDSHLGPKECGVGAGHRCGAARSGRHASRGPWRRDCQLCAIPPRQRPHAQHRNSIWPQNAMAALCTANNAHAPSRPSAYTVRPSESPCRFHDVAMTSPAASRLASPPHIQTSMHSAKNAIHPSCWGWDWGPAPGTGVTLSRPRRLQPRRSTSLLLHSRRPSVSKPHCTVHALRLAPAPSRQTRSRPPWPRCRGPRQQVREVRRTARHYGYTAVVCTILRRACQVLPHVDRPVARAAGAQSPRPLPTKKRYLEERPRLRLGTISRPTSPTNVISYLIARSSCNMAFLPFS